MCRKEKEKEEKREKKQEVDSVSLTLFPRSDRIT